MQRDCEGRVGQPHHDQDQCARPSPLLPQHVPSVPEPFVDTTTSKQLTLQGHKGELRIGDDWCCELRTGDNWGTQPITRTLFQLNDFLLELDFAGLFQSHFFLKFFHQTADAHRVRLTQVAQSCKFVLDTELLCCVEYGFICELLDLLDQP
jgi:hypothetical protein